MLQNSTISYRIPGEDCKQIYIRLSSTLVEDRITADKGDFRKNKNKCTLAQHFINLEHKVGYDSVRSLDHFIILNKIIFLETSNTFEEPLRMNSKRHIEVYTILSCTT